MAFVKPLAGRDEHDADGENQNALNENDVRRRTEVPQNPLELLQYYKDRIGACALGLPTGHCSLS